MKHSDLRHLGVILPAGNMALEWELPRHLPEGYVLHYSRVYRPGGTRLTQESLRSMSAQVAQATRNLERTRARAILYGCTNGSFIDGPQDNQAMSDNIASVLDVPAITTSTAAIQALQHLDVRRMHMITPYTDDINQAELQFFAHHGIEVVGIDALFISCTNLLTFDQIQSLEQSLDRPVISSNLASLLGLLCAANAPGRHVALGRLFATVPPAPASKPRTVRHSQPISQNTLPTQTYS